MTGSREKLITFEVAIEITDEAALQEASGGVQPQDYGVRVQAIREPQTAVDSALMALLRVDPAELPGARIVGLTTSIEDDNRRERYGFPPVG